MDPNRQQERPALFIASGELGRLEFTCACGVGVKSYTEEICHEMSTTVTFVVSPSPFYIEGAATTHLRQSLSTPEVSIG